MSLRSAITVAGQLDDPRSKVNESIKGKAFASGYLVWWRLTAGYTWIIWMILGSLLIIPIFQEFGFLTGAIYTAIGWIIYVKTSFPKKRIVKTYTVMGKSIEIWYPLSVRLRFRFWGKHKVLLWRFRCLNLLRQTVYRREVSPYSFVKFHNVGEGIVRLDLITPPGLEDEDVVGVAGTLQAGLHLVRVSTTDLDERGGFVSLILCETDPLKARLGEAPILTMGRAGVADPYRAVPVGINAEANPISLPLFLREAGGVRSLTAGRSGSGKSGIFRQHLLYALACPEIDVAITDGKGSEFPVCEPYADNYFSLTRDGLDGFWKQLEWLEAEKDRRAEVLRRHKLENPDRVSESLNPTDDNEHLLVWFWDELSTVRGQMDSKQIKDLDSRLNGLITVVRSLGMSVLFSSQSYKAEIISTQTRSQMLDLCIGYQLANLTESGYIGFTSSDLVRPDLINGKIEDGGGSTAVGQFAVRGDVPQEYGKSYYVSSSEMRDWLGKVGVSK